MTGAHAAIHWTGIGVALANHLWQSSIFATAVWLTTLLMRGYGARVRYRLWAAASLKFLFPLSLLVGFGSLFAKPALVAQPRQVSVYWALSEASQPFSSNPSAPPATTAINHGDLGLLLAWLPAELGILWFGGALIVLLMWFLRWRKLSRLLRQAIPVRDGREWEIFSRLDSPKRLQFRCVPELAEPGVFGLFRPVLLWPELLSEQLTDEQLESILIHEITHVYRHDNLIAAIHMAVEALFWFHPMIWRIEKHMVEERECACDEAAVDSGVSAQIYAEGLLRVCRLCIESSLICISGVTGADLSHRVQAIMSSQRKKLNCGRRLAVCVLVLIPIMGPVALGMMQKVPLYLQILQPTGPRPAFEVATFKTGRSHAEQDGASRWIFHRHACDSS